MRRSAVLTYINRVSKAHDIRRKLLITLLILAIYRLAAHIPVPGADREAIVGILEGGGAAGALIGIFDLLSGGTVSNFSLLAMGVYPYITAQIILQLLIPIVPAWKQRMEEDQREGRRWMEKWTIFLAIPMAALQAIGQINLFTAFAGVPVVSNFGLEFPLTSASIILSMTAGTLFAIWLGELISEYGLRQQGLSLIIFAGIVAGIPQNLGFLFTGTANPVVVFFFVLLIMTLTIFAIVFIQQGRRNVPVMYPGRRVGNRMSMPVKGTLPLMVNMAGMIPLIFAQSILTFPAVVAGFFITSQVAWVQQSAQWVTTNLSPGQAYLYWIVYFLMVVAFTFFYTDVLFAQQNYGENLKRSGAQIPGVSRGTRTQEYLTRVLRRITFPGAVFLGLIAILPWLISLAFPQLGGSQSSVFLISSSGLLIVVGVVRDVFFSIDADLKLHGYDDTLLVR